MQKFNIKASFTLDQDEDGTKVLHIIDVENIVPEGPVSFNDMFSVTEILITEGFTQEILNGVDLESLVEDENYSGVFELELDTEKWEGTTPLVCISYETKPFERDLEHSSYERVFCSAGKESYVLMKHLPINNKVKMRLDNKGVVTTVVCTPDELVKCLTENIFNYRS